MKRGGEYMLSELTDGGGEVYGEALDSTRGANTQDDFFTHGSNEIFFG